MAITEGGFCEVEAPLPTGAVPGLQEGPLLPGTSLNTLHNPVHLCFPLSPGVACGPSANPPSSDTHTHSITSPLQLHLRHGTNPSHIAGPGFLIHKGTHPLRASVSSETPAVQRCRTAAMGSDLGRSVRKRR